MSNRTERASERKNIVCARARALHPLGQYLLDGFKFTVIVSYIPTRLDVRGFPLFLIKTPLRAHRAPKPDARRGLNNGKRQRSSRRCVHCIIAYFAQYLNHLCAIRWGEARTSVCILRTRIHFAGANQTELIHLINACPRRPRATLNCFPREKCVSWINAFGAG